MSRPWFRVPDSEMVRDSSSADIEVYDVGTVDFKLGSAVSPQLKHYRKSRQMFDGEPAYIMDQSLQLNSILKNKKKLYAKTTRVPGRILA